MGCENNCVNEHRLKSLEEDFRDFKANNSKDHKEFYKRIEDVEKDMIESQGDRKHITQQLDEINLNVKSLMEKPGKRYETVVVSIITAIVSVIVGLAMRGVFPM